MPSSQATVVWIAVLGLYVAMCDCTWCEPPGAPVPVQGSRPCQDSLLGRVEGVVTDVIDYLHDATCRGYRQLQDAFQPYRQEQPPFGSYLHLMGKAGSPDYIYCPGVLDDAEHTFFRCLRWERPRLEATRSLGAFSVDTVCKKIMDGEDNWDCLSRFVQGILRRKKTDLDREAD